ncbi:hypothetical protein NYQ10_01280 [Flavobacterium johnsoniae]|uniref:hypothetical protein n=1 Tax=Flavobacterium johnsoniae TaxID=986 RepID=UPI0025AF425A|nr:hypothetical protein [Flavobacterium johnsoniae]WJS95096.1 hypothetical protein NYQ10_01280 [Flavobacterium johnsoniae]
MNSQKHLFNNKTFLFSSLLFFFFALTANSQKQICKIYFDDGTVLSGTGKIRMDNSIKLKLNENDKGTDYDPLIIDRIELETDGISQVYKYKKEVDGFHKWLKVLIEGKVSLYKYDMSGFNFGTIPGSGFSGMGMASTPVTYYYVARGEDFEVSIITSLGNISKNFKKTASDYFKDCPVLVEKVNAKEFKKDDIFQVVKFYNTKCETENATSVIKAEN